MLVWDMNDCIISAWALVGQSQNVHKITAPFFSLQPRQHYAGYAYSADSGK